ncbi:hypothetical protein OUZ56_031336 [Daphnia magna]|uniref:Uncharacterized protein n=1 Tax=Daphnia magna TaxID=35525 RepID=A0ABQ9ZTY4_9CRUS|nr:hypothetical protein OUZ56_031336 [Daphnia magna]
MALGSGLSTTPSVGFSSYTICIRLCLLENSWLNIVREAKWLMAWLRLEFWLDPSFVESHKRQDVLQSSVGKPDLEQLVSPVSVQKGNWIDP